jgi:Ca2+-binding RTX toxin-like protein
MTVRSDGPVGQNDSQEIVVNTFSNRSVSRNPRAQRFDSAERQAVSVEALEGRQMMSVSVQLYDYAGLNNCIKIMGTLGADTIKVYPDGDNVCVNTDSDSAPEATYSKSLVDNVFVWGDWGNDEVNVYNTLDIDAYLCGGCGKDTLGGGGGDDTIWGGDGADQIDGDDGDDLLCGEEGDDYLEGDAGDDTLEGESGKDSLHGDTGDDLLKGGSGDDYLYGGSDDDELYGGDGSDFIKGCDGADVLHHDDDDWYVVVS